ncbi:CHAT domain-containing protein [Nocardiopsis composta]|uniref:Tetratricopeptide (TPR) repeat protein n=1 Tax=Nocardiopsis composta TaxID=157465 RepID=A0A7W8QS04_9ACTN|nr:CHAT domain-containing protein [Nocardiopsis composta]MBB5435439.1 tetratricopeptide (TPR) repeat protein [Nocardiopsis composta]
MTVLPSDDLFDSATLLARDPGAARRTAERTLASRPGPAARAEATRLLGLCLYEQGDTAGAERVLRRAAAIGAAAGQHRAVERARRARLAIRSQHGGPGLSGPRLGGSASPPAALLLRLGVDHAQRGRFAAAAEEFGAALTALPDDGGHFPPALLCNRGRALLYAGRGAEAEDDLQRALGLAEQRALGYLRGAVLQNLACLAGWHGDTARALELFAAAEATASPGRRTALALDRADALLSAGMRDEAAHCLASASPDRGAPGAEAASALLLAAKYRLSRGEHSRALDLARRLLRSFPPESLWSALARTVEWAALCLLRPDPAPFLAAVPSLPASPVGPPPGAGAPAAPLRTGALRADTLRAAARCVPYLPPTADGGRAGRARSAALERVERGDHSGALRLLCAVRSARLPGHMEAAGHAFPQEREIAAAALARALAAGCGAAALDWLEFTARAGSAAPTGGCTARTWAGSVDRFRGARLRAGADPGAAEEFRRPSGRLLSAQWHRCRPGRRAEPSGGAAEALRERLGDRAFIGYARSGGVHAAVTVAGGDVRVHPLPDAGEAEDAVAKLLFAARSRAALDGDPGAPLPAGDTDAVERLLLRPVAAAVGDRPLVLLPAPYAQGLPWGLLPSLRGREVCIAPSPGAWAALDADRGAAAGPALLACGPGLDGGREELRALRNRYGGAEVLERAGTAAVLRRLPGAPLAHLIGHGSVPSGTPMLSGILFADGPLFAYDVELLPGAPRLTVLSSCWTGRSVPAPSGAPLGLAAALIARGGRTVVAGVLPVRDGCIRGPMERFHAALAGGAGPARAVADHLAAYGFVCLGAG